MRVDRGICIFLKTLEKIEINRICKGRKSMRLTKEKTDELSKKIISNSKKYNLPLRKKKRRKKA